MPLAVRKVHEAPACQQRGDESFASLRAVPSNGSVFVGVAFVQNGVSPRQIIFAGSGPISTVEPKRNPGGPPEDSAGKGRNQPGSGMHAALVACKTEP